MSRRRTLLAFYEAMAARFGPSYWWPGETPFEVAVGAVLTQNTAWTNVEKALARLKAGGPLRPARLLAMPGEELEEAIRPSGFFRLKAVRLRNLLAYMASFDGFDGADGADLAFMQGDDTASLRRGLLAVTGVGPETADCILLYALGRPSFVVDAYTRRMLGRHAPSFPHSGPDAAVPSAAASIGYDELRAYFMDALPLDVPLYNEYHALIVRTGKAFCKKTRPLCHACPLGPFLDGLAAVQAQP